MLADAGQVSAFFEIAGLCIFLGKNTPLDRPSNLPRFSMYLLGLDCAKLLASSLKVLRGCRSM